MEEESFNTEPKLTLLERLLNLKNKFEIPYDWRRDFREHNKKYSYIGIAGLLFLFFIYFFLLRPPSNFPVGVIINIADGENVSSVAKDLKEMDIIRSTTVFKLFVLLINDDGFIISGDYFFSRPFTTWGVTRRVATGHFGISPIRVTIPEGANVFEIAQIFERRFGYFDPVDFLKRVKDREGYLFPDTYFFLPNVESKEVVKTMETNFKDKISSIQEKIDNSDKSLEEIIIMASILEEEAKKLSEKKVISGILWKRIKIGMALQVDATFQYINGKGSFELTLDDLAIDSAYNTYKNKGLPIGPISNPGLDSILATVEPEESPYFFYLHDRRGIIHYAKDFAGHKANKTRYLD